MRAFLFLLCFVTGSALAQEAPPLVRAQPEAPPPPSAPIELVLGEEVRVETPTRELSGAFRLLESGALSLQGESEQVESVLVAEVQRLSVRRRAVLPGLLIGGGTGAVVVAAYGVFVCAILAESQAPLTSFAGCGLVGALIGTVFGGSVGALLGLALPRWPTLYEREEQGGRSPRLVSARSAPSTLERWLFHPGPLGELGLRLEYAGELGGSHPDWGPGFRLHLLTRLGPSLALGPEVALHARVGSETSSGPEGTFTREAPLFQLGGVVRAGAHFGIVRPALVLGLAWYAGEFSHLGGSVGAEVELHALKGIPLVLAARYHDNLQRLGGADPSYVSFGVGSRLVW
jgi:hypothetical protein